MADLIDLTMPIEEGMTNSRMHPRSPLVWKCHTHGMTRHMFDETDAEGLQPSYMNEQVLVCGHTGTHVDAPNHVDPKSDADITDVSLEKLHGRGVRLDVREDVEPGAGVTVDDLRAAEDAAGTRLQTGDIALLQTGWAESFSQDDPDAYLDDHPGLSREAADWLAADRGIDTFAIDAPNVECHDTLRDMYVHNRFYRQERDDPRLIIENLTNLTAMDDYVYDVVAFPPPVAESTGFPARVVAFDR